MAMAELTRCLAPSGWMTLRRVSFGCSQIKEEEPMPHQKVDPAKDCEICGTPLIRKRYLSGRLEDRTVFLKRRHCSQACANSREVVQEDSHRWRARRVKARTACENCGATTSLHVHHRDRNPANNVRANLEVLCATCHLKHHWSAEHAERTQKIRESVGVSTNRRSGDGKRYLVGPPLARLNRIARESRD